MDIRRSTACLDQGNWSRLFVSWKDSHSMLGHFSTENIFLSVSAEGAGTIGPCC